MSHKGRNEYNVREIQFKKTILDFGIRRELVHVNDLKLEVIEDLDKAIDDICLYLEQQDLESNTEEHLLFAEDLCPYFGHLWPSALALCLSFHKTYLSGAKSWASSFFERSGKKQGEVVKLLEIGCGLALPSIYIQKLGLANLQITASDFHPLVEDFLMDNQKLNQSFFEYQRFNWVDRKAGENLCKSDLIIGSDILYESKHPREVAESLLQFAHEKTEIIITDPGRSYLQNFVQEMERLGMKHQMDIVSVEDNFYQQKASFVGGKRDRQKFQDIFVFHFYGVK